MVRTLYKPKSKYRVGLIVVEVTIAVILTYFFIGGYAWASTLWAISVIVAAGIITMNLKWFRKKTEWACST